MGGLANLFKKLIPFITLFCFVCFGVSYAFKPAENQQLTYLKTQYYDINTGNIIENPTQEEKENAETMYTFDVKSYVENINQDIITKSTQSIFNLEAYQNTLNNFNKIWQNGYQVGDIIKTIGNAVLLLINTVILIINIIVFPLRFISGIILTALSLVGIDITNGIVLIPFLKFILNSFAIPFIYLTNTEASYTNELSNTIWLFNATKFNANKPTNNKAIVINNLYFTAKNPNGKTTKYSGISIKKSQWASSWTIRYFIDDASGNSDLVYNDGWLNNESKTITIGKNNLTQAEVTEMTAMLNRFYTKQTQ